MGFDVFLMKSMWSCIGERVEIEEGDLGYSNGF